MSGYIGTKASVVTPGAERKKVFSITTTTTSLTGLVYTPGFVHVFHNGVRLVDGTDYTATNGTNITLTTAAQNGDEVVVISYATFQTSDTVSASAGGTFNNDVAINGDLTVDTNTLFVDATNNRVGIGTSSPAEELHVYSNNAPVVLVEAAAGNDSRLRLLTPNDRIGYIEFGDTDDVDTGEIRYDHSGNFMAFHTNGNVERMRIDSSGNLLVGTTSTTANDGGISTRIRDSASGTTSYIQFRRGTSVTSAGTVLAFFHGGTVVGTVTHTSTATSYNTSSDYRLKEDVQPMVGASDRVLALKPVNFAWKDGGQRVDGFLAHEAQAVVPEAVHGTKDEVDADGNPVYQGIDQSKLVPLLTAALQEALTKIDALEARIVTLEGGAA